MKLSLKFRDDTNQTPLLRAKIPITVLTLPLLSSVSAGDSSDLSFSLRTHFSSGPSLSLSYRPTPTPNPLNPFSLSLKSGVGLFGSPNNSPLVFSAHFHLHNSGSSLVPAFSLHVKPQFGNFSLRKSTSSSSSSSSSTADASSVVDSDLGSGAAFSLDRALQWKDLKGGEGYRDINGMLSGIHVTAKTSVPLMRSSSSVVNFRWGVNFPSEGAKGALSRPVLVLNKIGLERIEGVKKEEVVKKKMIKKRNADSMAKMEDLELLKGVCGWMGREMEDLQRQNREIRQALEGAKTTGGYVARVRGGEDNKKGGSVPKASDFGRWRSKKSGVVEEEDGQKDWNKAGGGGRMSELESELQKALKANNGSAAS